MTEYIGMAVHGYRNPYSTSEETVTRVIATGNHSYQPGSQHETAIKATTVQHPRPRWYIGYGGDYVPAGKADLANIELERSTK